MKISVQPFSADHEGAVVRFNERMRRASAPSSFLLPERAKQVVPHGQVTVTHYVAVDDEGEVRGGMMCMDHPAIAGGEPERAVNIQSPLSEGIIDPAFTFVAPQLIKHAIRQARYAFVVGMGGASNPLPRLLKAMGWTLHTVPFYFQILRASRCVRNLAPLRGTALKRAGGTIAAMTGVAALGATLVHRPSSAAKRAAADFKAQAIDRWSSSADDVWDTFHTNLSFGVVRTTGTLPFFYPFDAGGPRCWWLVRNGRIEGWFGLLITPMKNNPYFGNLVVATLTDCVGTADAVRAGISLAGTQARDGKADLLITNQQHRLLREACTAAGWRNAASNFLVATSPAMKDVFRPETAYVTRRDGDGLTNLRG
jgi:hypothetical protein